MIRFRVPVLSPDGNAWKPNETVVVGVVIEGQPADKTLTLTVGSFQISLDSLLPATAKQRDLVWLYGVGFGDAAPDNPAVPANSRSALLLGGIPVTTNRWSDGQIQFMVPDVSPDGNAWKGTEPTPVGMIFDGHPVEKTLTLTVVGSLA